MWMHGEIKMRALISMVSVFLVCLSLLEGCATGNPSDSANNNSPTTPQTNKGAGDFTIQNGDISLGGTLTLPSTPGPHPAVILVHGSGRVTRNNFASLSTLMGDVGIALLRYDKRGVGESTGNYRVFNKENSVRLVKDLAGDALAWVEFLRNHEDIDSEKIGLIGGSQAGWINPLAASMSEHVAFIVNFPGPTVTVGQEYFYSTLTGGQQFNQDRTINGFTIEQLTEMTRKYMGVQGFDPVPSIRSLNIPGLWVQGELDESIPGALSIEILEGIIQEDNRSFTIQLKPNANHNFRNVLTGQQISYITPPGGVNDWILDVVNGN